MLPPGLHIREADIEGVTSWLWIEDDTWAWNQAAAFPALRDAIVGKCRNHRTIIQAGGCLGMYPRLWANSFGLVYTFEPVPLNFLCLSVNCSNAPVVKIQAALSNVHGMCSMERGGSEFELNAGAYKICPAPGYIPKLRIDDFEYEFVDAIQLDCEGHELAIIEGAENTIRRHLPVVCVELSDGSIANRLLRLGYREVLRCNGYACDPDVIFAPTLSREDL